MLFGRPVGDTLRFEEKAGLVEVNLLREGGEVVGAAIKAPKPLTIGAKVAGDLVARCASIDPAAIRHTTHAPVFASVGLPFVFAEVNGIEDLGSARPNLAVFTEAAALHESDVSLFLYARDPERPWDIRARMFAPLDNVMEDPATGSASAALGAYLVSLLPQADADVAIRIEQGVEMGRRSIIEIAVRKAEGQVVSVVISGRSVDVMSGRIAL
jgi:trans-2,3-dihydro-3-hydroxyanthranilate isomerase